MDKLNINKLIANDIINYGMDKTTGTNYIVELDEFLNDYDEETKDYIKTHIKDITDEIEKNENVADLYFDDKRNEFDMVFYYGNLLSDLERKVASKEENLDFEEIRDIANDIEDSKEYDELIDNKIEEYSL